MARVVVCTVTVGLPNRARRKSLFTAAVSSIVDTDMRHWYVTQQKASLDACGNRRAAKTVTSTWAWVCI